MVQLDGQLEGPRPLRVSGKATFKILFCHFSVHFDTTLISGEAPPPPPAVDVLAQLVQALTAPSSWSIARTSATPHGVALRSLPPSSSTLVLDPLGQLTVKQQLVPLNLTRDIDTFDGAPVSGDRRFTLSASLGNAVLNSTNLQAAFAPAQYFTMTDDEKLVAPSFEDMDAGCVFGDSEVKFAEALPAPLQYRTISIQPSSASVAAPASAPPPPYILTADQLVNTFSRSGSAARAPIRQVGRARFRKSGAPPAATLNPKSWSIVPRDLGAPLSLDPSVRTWSEYHAVLNTLNRARANWQLIPTYETES
jgi:hypothetical protein